MGSAVVVAYVVSFPPLPPSKPPPSPDNSKSDFTFTFYSVDSSIPLFLILTPGATTGSLVESAALSITLRECFFLDYLSVAGKGGCPIMLFLIIFFGISLLIVAGSFRGLICDI